MKQNKVLLTGYLGSENDLSTTEVMLNKVSNKYAKFLFSNDFSKIETEAKNIVNKKYKYIIMFGYKPLIKNLSIEIECHNNNEYLYTNFPFAYLLNPLKEHNIRYVINDKPGTSYCNYAYYCILKNIQDKHLSTKVIFIHTPHLNNFIELDKVINILNKYDNNIINIII